MPIYTTRKFKGGISGENNKGIAGSFQFGYGLDIRSRDNVLTCNQALVKESVAIVTDLIRFIVPCSDGNAYGFGDTGKIYKRKGTTWTLEYTDANGAIKGADEWNGYLYWACDTKISRILVTQADDGTWGADVAHDWNTTLTAATWHTMKKALGEFLICNDQYLALIDYASAAFTAQAVRLQPGSLAKCLFDVDEQVIIGTTDEGNAEKAYYYSWALTALHYLKKRLLPAKGINALLTTEFMLAQAGVDGEVYPIDLVSNVPLFRFPDGGSVLPGGVCNRKGLAMFGVSGNSSSKCGVYSWGRSEQNFDYALNLDYIPSPGIITGIDIGAVSMVNGTLLVAWKSGSTYGVDALSATVKASGVYEDLEYDARRPDQRKQFSTTLVVLEPLPKSCSFALKYKFNNASTWTVAKTLDGASSFSTENGTEAEFAIHGEGRIFERRLELTPNANNAPRIKSMSSNFGMPELTQH